MASTAIAPREIHSLESILGALLNKQLQNICQLNGLKTSGIKAELQKRIGNALRENAQKDPATYKHIKESIHSVMAGSGRGANGAATSAGGSYGRTAYNSGQGIPHMAPGTHISSTTFGQNGFGYGTGQSRSGYGGGSASAATPQRPSTVTPFRQILHASGLTPRAALQFKPSPFYKIESIIGDVRTCEVMAQHRNSITILLRMSDEPSVKRCVDDKSLRVMVFCAGDDTGVQDIAFPHQSELKINCGEIKANLRGLKGKPGSTRPVDITDSLRLDKTIYVNTIEFTYALTNKVKSGQDPASQKFFLALCICKTIPVDELVGKIKGRKIPKASVIRELTKAAHDPDVVATSQVLSLKCPLSYTRLRTPCRSTSCSHIQCFDAEMYLQLQQQGPQWICPVCNKSATFDSLAIDEYVKEILDNTSSSIEQVTIEPDGQWRTDAATEPEPKRPRYSGVAATASLLDDDDDDDIVALDDFSGGSTQVTQTPNRSVMGTPASTSGNGTRLYSNPPGSNPRKRPAEVIDLTLSDDDDDPPVTKTPKRQNIGLSPSPGFQFPY
ncbi:PINIT domain-containing protein [Xylariales sp. PMI_506]|nr:PINIT domain-containing protein [Xylariales sp. PMI_506]